MGNNNQEQSQLCKGTDKSAPLQSKICPYVEVCLPCVSVTREARCPPSAILNGLPVQGRF